MGWGGYTIYAGDDTQTRHYDFIHWAEIKVDDDLISEWLILNKTKIPKEYLDFFIKGIPKIIKKMPKKIFFDEYKAIEWQMLLSLFIDNKIKPIKIIYDMGIEGTKFLMGQHASEFDRPNLRRQNLRNFIKRAKKNGYTKRI